MTKEQVEYIAGVCNLNQEEVEYRKKAGYFGTALGVLMLIALVVLDANPLLGLTMFIPVWIASIGFLQASNKFCVSYGAQGVYNTSTKMGDTTKADSKQAKKDKKRASQLNTQSLIYGLLGAAVSYALLLFV